MKEIILKKENSDFIDFCDVDPGAPIFATKESGEICGMVVNEKQGWIVRIGGSKGVAGHYPDLKECLFRGAEYNYTFLIGENNG